MPRSRSLKDLIASQIAAKSYAYSHKDLQDDYIPAAPYNPAPLNLEIPEGTPVERVESGGGEMVWPVGSKQAQAEGEGFYSKGKKRSLMEIIKGWGQ